MSSIMIDALWWIGFWGVPLSFIAAAALGKWCGSR
jgi:hypothetical protein